MCVAPFDTHPLCASKETIPRSVEYLIRETYNWLSVSPKRWEAYKAVYATINCGQKPLQITKVCATRWLSIEPVVTRILSQWEELKLHFELAKASEHCYMADVLHTMYMDKTNYVYLQFFKSILSEVQVALKSFEGEQTDPVKLLYSLVHLLTSICSRVINPMAKIDVLKDAIDAYLSPSPYLGYLFESTVTKIGLAPENEKVIWCRCINYIIALSKELQARLPDNLEALQNMAMFSVKETLKH